MKSMNRSPRNPNPALPAVAQPALPWRIYFWLMAAVLLLMALTARAQYAPFGTNVWPWNVNTNYDACTNAAVPYVIAGGYFNTTTLTSPASTSTSGRRTWPTRRSSR